MENMSLKVLEKSLIFSPRKGIKQMNSMLPCVCSLTDHRRRQNTVRTSVTDSPNGFCVTFLFLSNFNVICDLLLNRHTAAPGGGGGGTARYGPYRYVPL